MEPALVSALESWPWRMGVIFEGAGVCRLRVVRRTGPAFILRATVAASGLQRGSTVRACVAFERGLAASRSALCRALVDEICIGSEIALGGERPTAFLSFVAAGERTNFCVEILPDAPTRANAILGALASGVRLGSEIEDMLREFDSEFSIAVQTRLIDCVTLCELKEKRRVLSCTASDVVTMLDTL
eukprot:m51a1_g3396 hypothetical protein (187) ;mRNA; r:526564-527415